MKTILQNPRRTPGRRRRVKWAAGSVLRFNCRLAVMLGLLLAAGYGLQRLAAQTTTHWALDLNGDSLTDVSRIQVYAVEFIQFPMGGGIYVQHINDYLSVGGGGALLEASEVLTTNVVVSLDPGPRASWQSSLYLLSTDGYMTYTNLPYVGVRFSAADGNHLGWIKLGNAWNVDDFGWQPRPEEPIRVGDKPPALPTENESVTLVTADLDYGGIDFVLRVRRWTNEVSGVTGVSAVLTNRPGFEVLAVAGSVEGRPVWFPWPVGEGRLIPTNAPAPASWQAPDGGVVLLEERHDAQGGLWLQAGPLANRTELVIGLRRTDQPARLMGWLRFGRDCEFLGQDLRGAGYVVGEPATLEQEQSRDRWDLDGDGQIEFVAVSCRESWWDWMSGCWVQREWSTLFPLRQARLLSGAGLPVDALIPAGPGDWVTNRIELRSVATAMPGGAPLGSNVFAGILGLRFATQCGIHLAWTRATDGSFAFEPRPGVPLPAGRVPDSIWAAVTDGELAVTWNRSLGSHDLEATASLESPDWQPVPVEVPGRAVLALAAGSRFFRLAPNHDPGAHASDFQAVSPLLPSTMMDTGPPGRDSKDTRAKPDTAAGLGFSRP